jgi:hypothetical protein
MWDTTAFDLHILGSAIGITSTYSISKFALAINHPVWHSHSVLIAQSNTMKHFIQSDAQVMPVIRRGSLRAKNGLWTPGASRRSA